ncbi:DUF3169 family protein [Lachnotalea glycerini]|uniref:DUF3169 family protein n=1 Tax=Lachnotalea glycerini TaxID=1763509 RepID=A0A371J756_9FIRM|nr:DUF3169 family protein [Lachnotalea glycerini]RDY28602.1 DUF3169 family protein [Lachnotalea glycerini]
MSSEKLHEIKKEDKKAIKKFIVILILSALAGGVVGYCSVMFKEKVARIISESLLKFLLGLTPIANLILPISGLFFILYLYQKSRRLYQEWDGEDEEEMAQIELYLAYALWLSSILTIVSFFLFAVGFYNIIYGLDDDILFRVIFITGALIVSIVIITISHQKIVNFLKEINPEKKGSVFEAKFAKTWEKSCDEAEKLSIYKAAYKAYQTVNRTCSILWLMCVLGAMVWDFGLLPVTLVSVIWIVQISSYCKESIRLSSISNKNY